jgi:hypothetical protein
VLFSFFFLNVLMRAPQNEKLTALFSTAPAALLLPYRKQAQSRQS